MDLCRPLLDYFRKLVDSKETNSNNHSYLEMKLAVLRKEVFMKKPHDHPLGFPEILLHKNSLPQTCNDSDLSIYRMHTKSTGLHDKGKARLK